MTEAAARLAIDQPGRQRLVVMLEEELIIGRDCEGLLLADSQVSRRHLRLRPTDGAIEVADLGSTNGSFLNGAPLTTPELLDGNALLVIGDTSISLELQPERAATNQTIGVATSRRPTVDLRTTSIDLVADFVSSGVGDVDPIATDGRTTTIVFSDIESSTERANEMGDEPWFELLEEHNGLIRSEVRRCGGTEIKSIGDGFMLTFDSVRGALRFTGAVQEQFESEAGPDLRVRMGLHTGEAMADTAGDLFGRHVNLAARVANLADGGQVMASLVVHEIAVGRADVTFGPPNHVELKGFTELQTVFEVLWQEGTLP